MHWYQARNDDYVSPVVRGMNRYKPADRKGKRILGDEEIRALWACTADMGTYGVLIRLLLLTAQRCAKVVAMQWDDLADGVWTIPAERRRRATRSAYVCRSSHSTSSPSSRALPATRMYSQWPAAGPFQFILAAERGAGREARSKCCPTCRPGSSMIFAGRRDRSCREPASVQRSRSACSATRFGASRGLRSGIPSRKRFRT